MAHPRKLIRLAVKDRLALPLANGTFRTGAQARVYPSRLAPVAEEDLRADGPAILIYTRNEKYHPDKDYGVEGQDSWRERDLQLVTEAMCVGGETVDDMLDDLAEQIEAALDDWTIPGFESARVRLVESDIDLITEQVKRPIGAIGLVWQVIYRTNWKPSPADTMPMPDEVWRIISGGEREQIE